MANEDDIPDYLSDEFLVECVPDIRPGLIHYRADKRKHELSKKQEEANSQNKLRNKSRTQIEEDARQIALQKEIPADNKGFQLLQKMGYKPGTSLGKGVMEGLKTPIGVEVKTNRKGLGHKSVVQEKRAKLDEFKVKRELAVGDYRQRIQLATVQKETMRDLRKAQSVCQNLDIKHNKASPLAKWYWPEIPKVEKQDDDSEKISNEVVEIPDSEDEEDEPTEEEPWVEPSEQLKLLVEYLRQEYFYCLWCGTHYDNSEDFESSCPGATKDDH